ncbi:hypothetical protein [Streptomyces somaliensis]
MKSYLAGAFGAVPALLEGQIARRLLAVYEREREPGAERRLMARTRGKDTLGPARKAKLGEEPWPEVWCLLDRDEHQQIPAALKLADEAGYGSP